MTKERVLIFDTTLRDGEQSPGASMNKQQKIAIAEALDNMGVDVIEAGFAAASEGDFSAVAAIAEAVKSAEVCSLSRAKKTDIETAAQAIKKAVRPRIHTFISTSSLHRKHKLNMSEEQVLEAIAESVSFARRFTDQVEWSAEDATRTEREYLARAVEQAITSGARTINIPDTVGYTTPEEFFSLIKWLRETVPNSDLAVFSVHCHNDLGLAVANSLAAVRAGARQIECTINGLGERAGNAALEEVVMAMRTRPDILPFTNNIDTTHITRVSRLVSTITGFLVQNNKAIVGANAFAHESGIHQDGMLKHAGTYEIMTPESVGLSRSQLVLGKLSGRHALKKRLESLGINVGDNAFEEIFSRFKNLADKKREIYDEDLIALIDNASAAGIETVQLSSLHITCGLNEQPRARVAILYNAILRETEASGGGPVDALFHAISSLVPHEATLALYQVHSVTGGTDAQAEVTVRLQHGECTGTGHGRDTDTMVASAQAYISALNRLLSSDTKNAEKKNCASTI
jgi:2-isopropylmalate synthase